MNRMTRAGNFPGFLRGASWCESMPRPRTAEGRSRSLPSTFLDRPDEVGAREAPIKPAHCAPEVTWIYLVPARRAPAQWEHRGTD